MLEKIVQGRLEKFKDEVVLSRQAYIRDESITVEKLILQNVAAIGEYTLGGGGAARGQRTQAAGRPTV